MKRIVWKKLEARLNAMGFLTPPQAKKEIVRNRFYKKHPKIYPQDAKRDLHELTFTEFLSVFNEESLRLTGYQGVRPAIEIAKAAYKGIIVKAIQQNKEHISIEGIEMIRFISEHMKRVRRYCRKRGLTLS